MNDELLRQILNQKTLPSIPQVALEVVRLCGSEDVSIEEIGRVVSNDPAIAARVLRMANSPVFGTPNKIGTVGQAVSILGLRTVCVVTLSSALVDGIDDHKVEGFDYPRFWSDALACALAARSAGALSGSRQLEEAFLGGLLQDLGVYGLSAALGRRYFVLVDEARSTGAELSDVEESFLGLNHADVSAALMERWRFPEQLVESVRRHVRPPREAPSRGAPEHTMAVLFVAEHARRVFRRPTLTTVEDFVRHAETLLGLGREQANEVLVFVQDNIRRTSESLNLELGGHGNLSEARTLASEILVRLTMESVAEAARSTTEAEREARTDPVTEGPNRRAVDAELERLLRDRAARGCGLGVLLVDLDRFKTVNDRFGHRAGDAVLRAVARVLEVSVTPEARTGRFGGEEFLVLVPDVSRAGAEEAGERLRRNVEALAVDHEGSPLRVTASVGIAWLDPETEATAAQAVEEADRALYAAKEAGRNRVVAGVLLRAAV